MTYLLSWHQKTTSQKLQRRPWWNIFGRDSLVTIEQWTRKTIKLDSKPDIPTVESTVAAFAGCEVWGLQLEEMPCSAPFIATGCTSSVSYIAPQGLIE